MTYIREDDSIPLADGDPADFVEDSLVSEDKRKGSSRTKVTLKKLANDILSFLQFTVMWFESGARKDKFFKFEGDNSAPGAYESTK